MTLIMHIGDGKCGSSAIQSALHLQRDALSEAGILFDTGPSRRDHFLLTTLLGKITRSSISGQVEYAERNLHSMAARMADHDHVLISDESLFGAEPAKVMELLDNAGLDTSSTRAVAYVRPPCSMYPSLIQQQLKGRFRFIRPDKYNRPIHKFIAYWQKVLGREMLTVRLFDRDRLLGQDVVTDFAAFLKNTTGRAVPDLPKNQKNSSLSAEQIIVLQALRRSLPPEADGKFHHESDQLISAFGRMNAAGQIGGAVRLSTAAEAVIHKNNTAIVAQVNRLVPNLAMETGASAAARNHAPGDRPWQNNPSVAAVLQDVDGKLVALLSQIALKSDVAPETPAVQELIVRYGTDQGRNAAISAGVALLAAAN